MTSAATIYAKLMLDNSDYKSKLKESTSSAQTFRDKMKAVGSTMMATGGYMTAGITMPIIAAGGSMIKFASDLNESQNAMRVTFGDGADQIEAFGEHSAETIGLAKSDWYQLAAIQGAALQNYGYNSEQAADETIKLGQRAADLASIFNTDVNDAMVAISSLMRGETEPIKRYGVSMSQAAIEAKAMSMGLIESTVDMTKVNGLLLDLEKGQKSYNEAVARYGEDSLEARDAAQSLTELNERLEDAMSGSNAEMTQAQKAQASLALFYEQTDRFAGDFLNTADGLANSTRILTAQFKDEAAALGAKLLPYALQFVQFLSSLLTKFQSLTPEQQKWIGIILLVVAAVGPLILIIGSLVTAISAIIPVITAVAGLFTFPLIAIIAVVIAILALLYYAWTSNLGGIREIVAEVWEAVTEIFEDGAEFIYDLTHGNLGELSAIWDRTTAYIKMSVITFITIVKTLFKAFGAALRGDWQSVGLYLGQAARLMWEQIKHAFLTGVANIKSAFSGAISALQSMWNNIDWGALGRNMMDAIKNAIFGAIPNIVSAVSSLVTQITGLLSGFLNGINLGTPTGGTRGGGGGGGAGGGGGNLYAASGTDGWIKIPSGYPNDSFPMFVESGEHVNVVKAGRPIPGGGGGGTVNQFNPIIQYIASGEDQRIALRSMT